MTLQERYRVLLDELAERFAKLMHKQGYWSDDYTLWFTEYEAWDANDMFYIINNKERLLERGSPYMNKYERIKALRNDVEAWIEYNVDVAQFGIRYINLKSWLMGAPRMSKEKRKELCKLREDLDKACREMQEVYGEQYNGSQPEHLRALERKIE